MGPNIAYLVWCLLPLLSGWILLTGALLVLAWRQDQRTVVQPRLAAPAAKRRSEDAPAASPSSHSL